MTIERASDPRGLTTVQAQALSVIRGLQFASSYLNVKASLLTGRRATQTALPSRIRGCKVPTGAGGLLLPQGPGARRFPWGPFLGRRLPLAGPPWPQVPSLVLGGAGWGGPWVPPSCQPSSRSPPVTGDVRAPLPAGESGMWLPSGSIWTCPEAAGNPGKARNPARAGPGAMAGNHLLQARAATAEWPRGISTP